ncbi:MAG: hypothetical protein AB7H81_05295 [Vicinamibacterales bacterium]
MTKAVDLVVVGQTRAAHAAAADALRRGQRVLMVLASGDERAGRRVRRRLRLVLGASGSQIAVMTGAQIACVDGIDGVEAVVVRYVKTGRLRGVNASAIWQTRRRTADSFKDISRFVQSWRPDGVRHSDR